MGTSQSGHFEEKEEKEIFHRRGTKNLRKALVFFSRLLFFLPCLLAVSNILLFLWLVEINRLDLLVGKGRKKRSLVECFVVWISPNILSQLWPE